MPPYILRGCTVDDGPAIARNNMSAFWTDDNWVLLWKGHRTLDQVIEAAAKRQPRNLTRDRELVRHQVAVDSETGKIVGYARWKLHPKHVELGGETRGEQQPPPPWAEAQVLDVSEAQRAEFEALAQSADWCPSTHMDGIDEPVTKMKNELLAKKDYILLDYLAVHPENMGKGIGSLLVQSGLRQAEKLGADVFVLALIPGKRLYTKLGFKLLDQLEQDDSQYGGTGLYGTYFMEYVVNKDGKTT